MIRAAVLALSSLAAMPAAACDAGFGFDHSTGFPLGVPGTPSGDIPMGLDIPVTWPDDRLPTLAPCAEVPEPSAAWLLAIGLVAYPTFRHIGRRLR